MKILVVEDEVRLAEALEHIMKSQKYLCDVAHTGTDGLYYALNEEYDVIILDIMLPGLSGFEVVKSLREQKRSTPVLLLTAKDDIPDKVQGLDYGADDYMTKPFSQPELLARVRALSRRPGDVLYNEIEFADLRLCIDTSALSCGDKSLRLGFKELEVMRALICRPSMLVSKEELISKVWGVDSDADDNNVEAYISFLRKKLAHINSRVKIETARKVGYRLEDTGNDSQS